MPKQLTAYFVCNLLSTAARCQNQNVQGNVHTRDVATFLSCTPSYQMPGLMVLNMIGLMLEFR